MVYVDTVQTISKRWFAKTMGNDSTKDWDISTPLVKTEKEALTALTNLLDSMGIEYTVGE